jgi:YidC/Oxa1 family membrane protein insertase
MSSLFSVPVDVAYNLVSALAAAFAPLLGGLAVAVAIIVFTMAVRLLAMPLSYYAFRGEKARARLAPQVQELQRRHARQPERLSRELTALYQAEGTGMFAGCLPALLQIPFFSVVYRLFLSHRIGGGPNTLLTHDLLGAPLSSHWFSGPGPFSAQGGVFAILFVLLFVVAVFSMRAARRAAAAGGAAPQPGGAAPPGRMMAALTRFMPFGTVLMAGVLPLAAGLYLLTTTAWTVTERTVLRRAMNRKGQDD